MNKPDTNTLLERCKRKDSLAFKELYGLYAKAMFNISMRIVNDQAEAEDILQEAFVKAFKDMNRFETIPAFTVWIKKVIINQSLDVVRKRKIQFVDIEEQHNTEDTQDADQETDYDMQTIMQCVRELPQGYRVILTLYLFEELSHKEIAEKLNISEGTSKSQYNRAKKKLAELVKQKSNVHV